MAVQYAFGQIVTNGLVLSLDAADRNSYPRTGTTWRDLTQNRYIGTLTNGPTFNTNNGGAIVFDGVDDYVDVSSPESLNPGSSSFSVDYFCRINIGNFASCAIEARGNGLWGFLVVAYYPGGYISLFLNTTSSPGQNVYLSTTAPVEQGIWFHTAIVADRLSNQITFYYNGIQTGDIVNTVSGTINGGGYRYWVGGDLGGNPMSGQIAILRQYNRTLSAAEVLQNYNAQKTRFGL